MNYAPPSRDANGAWNPPELIITPAEVKEIRLRFLVHFLSEGMVVPYIEYENLVFEVENYLSKEERKLLEKIENNASESLWDNLNTDNLQKALALVATTNYGKEIAA